MDSFKSLYKPEKTFNYNEELLTESFLSSVTDFTKNVYRKLKGHKKTSNPYKLDFNDYVWEILTQILEYLQGIINKIMYNQGDKSKKPEPHEIDFIQSIRDTSDALDYIKVIEDISKGHSEEYNKIKDILRPLYEIKSDTPILKTIIKLKTIIIKLYEIIGEFETAHEHKTGTTQLNIDELEYYIKNPEIEIPKHIKGENRREIEQGRLEHGQHMQNRLEHELINHFVRHPELPIPNTVSQNLHQEILKGREEEDSPQGLYKIH